MAIRPLRAANGGTLASSDATCPFGYPGRMIAGRYQRVRLLGEGGMGHVYEANDTQTQRKVAVKQLRVERRLPEELARRFAREILATAQISSKHVVAIHDAGVDDKTGEPFMVM